MAYDVTDELNKKFDERYVIVPECGCWIWTGALTYHPSHRYGNLPVSKSFNYKAHRYSVERFHGVKLSKKDFVCHKCDVSECVNPDHLYVGTPRDNARDRDARGRHVAFKGERHPMVKLTESQAIEIYQAEGNHRKIAERYNIARPTVTAIKNDKLWQHVTKNLRKCANA